MGGDRATTVSAAVNSRRSVRAFLERPVELTLLGQILEVAARAPSGGNLQPWHIHVLHGERMAAFKALMHDRCVEAPAGEGTEYPIYPAGLAAPYSDRRFEAGELLYGAIGIPREDKAARRQWFARNYQFFGAPVGLFCHVPRGFGGAQWSDLGMYLQTLMLLLREQGLDSCAQECWALYHATVSEFIGMRDDHMLFCGMAIGYADGDASANGYRTPRASVDDFVTFDPPVQSASGDSASGGRGNGQGVAE